MSPISKPLSWCRWCARKRRRINTDCSKQAAAHPTTLFPRARATPPRAGHRQLASSSPSSARPDAAQTDVFARRQTKLARRRLCQPGRLHFHFHFRCARRAVALLALAGCRDGFGPARAQATRWRLRSGAAPAGLRPAEPGVARPGFVAAGSSGRPKEPPLSGRVADCARHASGRSRPRAR